MPCGCVIPKELEFEAESQKCCATNYNEHPNHHSEVPHGAITPMTLRITTTIQQTVAWSDTWVEPWKHAFCWRVNGFLYMWSILFTDKSRTFRPCIDSLQMWMCKSIIYWGHHCLNAAHSKNKKKKTKKVNERKKYGKGHWMCTQPGRCAINLWRAGRWWGGGSKWRNERIKIEQNEIKSMTRNSIPLQWFETL